MNMVLDNTRPDIAKLEWATYKIGYVGKLLLKKMLEPF